MIFASARSPQAGSPVMKHRSSDFITCKHRSSDFITHRSSLHTEDLQISFPLKRPGKRSVMIYIGHFPTCNEICKEKGTFQKTTQERPIYIQSCFFSRIDLASIPAYIRLLSPYIFGWTEKEAGKRSRIYTEKEAEYIREKKPNI